MEIKKLRTVPPAAVPYTPMPSIGTSPSVSPLLQRSEKRRKVKDLLMPEYSDGGATDHNLRMSLLNMNNPEVREARKDHNRLFEFFLWTQYKSKDLIKVIKLPPIAGATKVQLQEYNSGTGGPYMEWDMVRACIVISQDHFKEHCLDNRQTRKKLQSLLDNLQHRLADTVKSTVSLLPQADLVCASEPVHMYTPPPPMHVVRDHNMSLVTLNTTAERSSSSLDITPSLPSDSFLDDLNSYNYPCQ
ncbi:hypothetical protein ACHWQZ_G018457 [Mnemiopsis leidyi]